MKKLVGTKLCWNKKMMSDYNEFTGKKKKKRTKKLIYPAL